MPPPENVFAEPPLIDTSLLTKSVTGFEKLKVTVRSAVELIFSGTPLIVTVGAEGSYCELASAAALPLPALSSAASLLSAMVTLPFLAGVIVALQTVPVVSSLNTEALPLVTWISPATKPVTVSLKVNVAVNAALLLEGTSIVTVGPVLSTW